MSAAAASSRSTERAVDAGLQQPGAQQAVLELTALAAFQNLSSKFNAALGVPAQGFCQRKTAR